MVLFSAAAKMTAEASSSSSSLLSAEPPKVYVLYENEEWLTPLGRALTERHVPFEGIKVVEGSSSSSSVSLDDPPPAGVFFNRISASSHTRGHVNSIALGGAMLAWLQCHGRRVINGRATLDYEVRKFDQYAALKAAGISVPKTIATTMDKVSLIEAAKIISGVDSNKPFIVKPNWGGKGLGVRLFRNVQEFEQALKQRVCQEEADDDFASLDGIQSVQEYIESKGQTILRNEFIGGRYYYSVEVSTKDGFELCPADACSIRQTEDTTNAQSQQEQQGEKFCILNNGFTHPFKDKFEAFLKAHHIEVAELETIEDGQGNVYCYDININTNYNKSAQAAAASCNGGNFDAYGQVAEF